MATMSERCWLSCQFVELLLAPLQALVWTMKTDVATAPPSKPLTASPEAANAPTGDTRACGDRVSDSTHAA